MLPMAFSLSHTYSGTTATTEAYQQGQAVLGRLNLNNIYLYCPIGLKFEENVKYISKSKNKF